MSSSLALTCLACLTELSDTSISDANHAAAHEPVDMTAGKQANKPAPNSIANAALEALYAMLISSKQHCKYLLTLPTLVQDLSSILSSLQGHHSGKMTAGACLARLCLIEMAESTDDKHVPTPDDGCYDPAVPLTHHFALAVECGVLDTVFHDIHEAILVSNLLNIRHSNA